MYCNQMEPNRVSTLLRTIRRIQFFSMLFQCSLILATALLAWKAIQSLLDQYSWPPSPIIWITGGAIGLAFLVITVTHYIAGTDRINAERVDEQYGLKERVTTYVELRKSEHPFLQPLIHECENHVADVSVWKSSRFFHDLILPAVLCASAAIALFVIPLLPMSAETLNKKEQRKQVSEAAKELEKTVRKLQQKPATPETRNYCKNFSKALKICRSRMLTAQRR